MSETELSKGEKDGGKKPHGKAVVVECDYLGADDPIERTFASTTVLGEVKEWAKGKFVPVPPSDKTYYLNDDKTRHRFTAEEEQRTLESLGYEHEAEFRLNEEQMSG